MSYLGYSSTQLVSIEHTISPPFWERVQSWIFSSITVKSSLRDEDLWDLINANEDKFR